MKTNAPFVVAGLVATMVLVSGCQAGGDPNAKQRQLFMSQEKALTIRPAGATTGGPIYGTPNGENILTDGVSTIGGVETQFLVSPTLNMTDVTSFYINLFASQHHRNIWVNCQKPKDVATFGEANNVYAAGWSGKVGYSIGVVLRHERPMKYGTSGTKINGVYYEVGSDNDPIVVTLQIAGDKHQFEGNNEDPVSLCDDTVYPRKAMVEALHQFGITPQFPNPPEQWGPFHTPLGHRNTRRKTPPLITPTFVP
jgi:hypothetical protein